MLQILEKIVGSHSKKKLKYYRSLVPKINQLEEKFASFSEADCKKKTLEFKELLQTKKKNKDSLLPEAFALVRKAAKDTIGERHFDVQLMGGMTLHNGAIAEMKTGEGKTLTSTLAAYLNALEQKGVHIVTVNEYLAQRDSEWMGQVFNYLGLSVGLIYNQMDEAKKKQAYQADIIYGTNNEFGFDYLRDNMKYDLESLVQRELNYAIIDEIDSILIDEARTPLIISGPADDQSEKYKISDKAVLGLTRAYTKEENPEMEKILDFKKMSQKELEKIYPEVKYTQVVTSGDFSLNEKTKSIQFTEQGIEKMEQRLANQLNSPSLFDFENIDFLHLLNQSLRARYFLKKDVDYVVNEGQVKIVDEFTGRVMEGRRFSEGLHQAIECKERVKIERENQTLASITFQNYFRKYKKLSGMTGTALTEENEFIKIYNLGVVAIPTNQPMVRVDKNDAIYKTQDAKYKAIMGTLKELNQKGQPVLIGTDSIATSEHLSRILKKTGLPHEVLNAKNHEREAEIIEAAGEKKSITISTNMAGRGTDIKLGKDVKELGGLFVLGTARHDSRRIDNQLRGRSGRQGDPGTSRFFLSLEDNLLRIFGGDKIAKLMDTMKIAEDEVIEHGLISKSILNAQKKVEGQNFNIRKHLIEYDDVMNRQREIIYQKRYKILNQKEDVLEDMAEDFINNLNEDFCPAKNITQWNLEELVAVFKKYFGAEIELESLKKSKSQTEIKSTLDKVFESTYKKREETLGEEAFHLVKRHILLMNTDHIWKEHLLSMDYLKEGIGLRGFGQKNPLDEYKREAFQLFSEMIESINQKCIFDFFNLKVETQMPLEIRQEEEQKIRLIHDNPAAPSPNPTTSAKAEEKKLQPVIKPSKIGRNSPCICGSGKKYKNCCLKLQQSA